MAAEHERFSTYQRSTVGTVPGESESAQNARLERERAVRYLNQANDAMRRALACLRRADNYEKES